MQNVGLLDKSTLSENVEGNPKFDQSALYIQSILDFKTQAYACSKEETNFVSWQALHVDW